MVFLLLCLNYVTQYDNLWHVARGTLFGVMWQPGWEGSLGENGYTHMYG